VSDEMVVAFDAPPTPEEWHSIREFRRRAVELAENSLLKNGYALRAKISWKADEGFSCIVESIPPEEPFRSLLLTFRLFWANDEASNFVRVLNIIGRYSGQPAVRQFLDALRSEWKQALFSGTMLMSFNNKSITADMVFDLWLNAHYFHSDPKKKEELEKLSKMLSPELMKFMLANAVTQCCRAILALHYAVQSLDSPEAAP